MTEASRPQQLLDLLAQSGNSGVWTYQHAVPKLWADKAACGLMGCTAPGSLDEWLQALEVPDRLAVQSEIVQALSSQSGFACHVQWKDRAGNVVQRALRGCWLRSSPSGAGELLCVVERMVTPYSIMRVDLPLSMAQLLDSSMVGMMAVELKGTVLDANDYILHLLQRSREELECGALNWIQMTPPDYLASTERMRLREQLLASGCCPPFERPMLRPDGSMVFFLMAVVMQPESTERALIVALDITQHKEAQAQLLKLNAQLEKRTVEAERAEAVKTLFLSSISHELRTPMHTILGYVRLLRKKAKAEDDEQLAIVERRGAYLLRLIDDLLEFNHTLVAPENLRLDFIDMDGFVRSLESMFTTMAEQTGNQFHLQLAELLPIGIVQDEGRLEQILRILVDNACKYTTHGNIFLAIDCQRQVDQHGRCRVSFAVQDSGRGIADGDLHHIFEPMRRGQNADDRAGLGLGLAIAEQWIHRMGSRIEVQSELGVGSRFGFDLLIEATFEVVPRWREPRTLQPTPRKALGIVERPALPPEELAMLGQLINMGRMARLGTWAQKLAFNHPELQAVADQVASLAAMAEVEALEQFYQQSMEQNRGRA